MIVKGMEIKGVIKVDNARIYGLEESIIASGYPKSLETKSFDSTIELKPSDEKRARNLGNATPGSGHDCYLKGIILQFDLQLPEYIWRQLNRYHHIDFVSSQSKMHKILELDVNNTCNKYVTEDSIDQLKSLIDKYNNFEEYKDIIACMALRDGEKIPFTKENIFRTIISNTPSGLMLTARMTTNYLQLKSIINQREHHKMHEWRYLVDWFKTLPMVNEIVVKKKEYVQDGVYDGVTTISKDGIQIKDTLYKMPSMEQDLNNNITTSIGMISNGDITTKVSNGINTSIVDVLKDAIKIQITDELSNNIDRNSKFDSSNKWNL